MRFLLAALLFIRNKGKIHQLSPIEKVVLMTIAGRIGKNKNTWISQKSLAEECSISVRYLIQILNKLIQKNILKSERKWRSNRYEFLFYQVNPSSPDKIDHQVNPSSCDNVYQVNPSSPDPVGIYNEVKSKVKDKRLKRALFRKKVKKISIPEWIPIDLWHKFLSNRKGMKSKMSTIAQKMLITKLTKFRDEGHNICELMETAIDSGWKTVWPPRQKFNGEITHKKTSGSDELQDYWNRLNGHDARREA
jgi:hypothetical protein